MIPVIGRWGRQVRRWLALAAAGLLALILIRRDAHRDARREADLEAAERREETDRDAAEKRQDVDRLDDAAVRQRLHRWARDAGPDR